MKRDIVLVSKPLDPKNAPWRIEIELTDDEFRLIGMATTQWAYLEHALLICTSLAAKRIGIPVPQDATNPSFTRRTQAWRQILEHPDTNDEPRQRGLRLLSRIANAENRRHKITHGLWDWNDDDPERMSVSSFRPRYQFEDITDIEKLKKLVDDIAEINFEMTFQEGPGEFAPTPSQSRFQRLGLAKIVPATPGPHPAKRPKQKRPRSPSKK